MLFMVRPDVKAIHRLADVLEKIGVDADELLDQKLPARDLASLRAMNDGELQAHLAGLRQFARRVQSLEMAIVAKLGQARERSRLAALSDWRLRPILMLFTAGTQAFADRLMDEANNADRAFDGSGQTFVYLRSRGVISESAASYDGSTDLLATDGFRLMGVLRLRDLLERCETTLNALDAHYDLYEYDDNDVVEIVEPNRAPIEELPERPVAAGGPDVNWGDVAVVVDDATAITAEPSESEIAAAQADSEAGLRSLSERLADLKAEPATEQSAEPTGKGAIAS